MQITIGIVVTGIVMFLALAGMIVCAKKQQTNPKAQPFAIALLVVVVICGFAMLYQTGVFGDGGTSTIIRNELKYAKSKAIILGREVGTVCAGDKILVVVDKNFDKNERQQTLLEGLKEGIDGKCEVVTDHLNIVPMGPDGQPLSEDQMQEYMMIPIEEMMQAQHYDELIEKHPDCKAVITMIGLPMNVGDMKVWTMPDESRPKMAILNGDIHNLAVVIHKGMIVAAVTYKPGVRFDEQAPPSDPQQAFDKRYLLITPTNIEEIAQKYEHIFALPE